MDTVQLTIRFGTYQVDKYRSADIKTAIDGDSGKQYVTAVNLPMVLVETGKQVMRISKQALSGLNVRDYAKDLGLNYISHSFN